MLISVIIPVYNGEKFIDKIYKSIKNQTYTNTEIIFVNDFSNDKSGEILQSLKKDKNVKVVSSRTNNGPGGAKNEGLKVSTGKYILFVDCDDFITPNYIRSLVDNCITNNYPDIVLSDFTKIDQNGKILYVRNYNNKEKAMVQKVSSVGKLINREYLNNNKIGLPYGKVLEDVLFHAALSTSNGTYSYINNSGYYYIVNDQSISHTTLKKFSNGALQQGCKYLLELKDNENLKKDELNFYAFKYICWHLLKSGNNVGTSNMMNEYEYAFKFLNTNFSNYKKMKYLKFKNERMVISLAIFWIFLLKKINLDRIFFKIYSNINLEKMWPKL